MANESVPQDFFDDPLLEDFAREAARERDAEADPRRWFVMLNRGDGNPTPLVDENESLAVFDDAEAADDAGFANPLGANFGFETYSWSHEPTARAQGVDRE
jgi:hypothetical protein